MYHNGFSAVFVRNRILIIADLVIFVKHRVRFLFSGLDMGIDPIHKWLAIKNFFVNIKISPTNLVFELIIQKKFYFQTRLVGLI